MRERIVQCHGCFDLLHLGHIRHFQAAKQQGDRLIVTVTPDRFVNKGPGRPAFPAEQRAEAIRALACVDEVQITDEPTAAQAIRRIRPAVFAKGSDYTPESIHPIEHAALRDVGAELVITQTEKFSSTAILQSQKAAEVLRYLDRAMALKVLVIGDAIRDEYHYVDTLGKSGKDPILAAQFVRAESFMGGVEAVAAHVGACSDMVHCVSGGRVTVKRRFIERYPFQKLFEVYDTDGVAVDESVMMAGLPALLDLTDLVVVADYGHGLLGPALVAMLAERAKFLAVNVQANAGNHGFNTIGKYRRADFVSISERELRLDARDQQAPVSALARGAAEEHNATVLVTRGEKGCYVVTPDGVSAESPALASHAVDRTGAGDAVFGVTACCAAVGMPLDLLAGVASVVGSQAVGIVGNQRYIERASLRSAVEAHFA